MAIEFATLGGGRFWVTEAVYQQIRGIKSVQPGYMGGLTEFPSYEEVCGGESGHAEVVRIQFDSSVVSYRSLLDVFFSIHEPKVEPAENGIKAPLRSVIFAHNLEQKTQAHEAIKQLERYCASKLATEVLSNTEFYPAEDAHQNFYKNNRCDVYCKEFIVPKILLSRDLFKKRLAA